VNDRFQIDDARFAEMLWSQTSLKELVTERFEEGQYDDAYENEGEGSSPAQIAERARRLWGGDPLGLNPNIRIYRYTAGQFFGQHCKSDILFNSILLQLQSTSMRDILTTNPKTTTQTT
jgi:hypothetical protein